MTTTSIEEQAKARNQKLIEREAAREREHPRQVAGADGAPDDAGDGRQVRGDGRHQERGQPRDAGPRGQHPARQRRASQAGSRQRDPRRERSRLGSPDQDLPPARSRARSLPLGHRLRRARVRRQARWSRLSQGRDARRGALHRPDAHRARSRDGAAPKGKIKFEVLIESVSAEEQVFEIAQASDRLVGLIFGAFDYWGSLRMIGEPYRTEHPLVDHARARIVKAAASVGIPAISEMTLNYPTKEKTPEQQKAGPRRVPATTPSWPRAFGFRGKWTGIPAQTRDRSRGLRHPGDGHQPRRSTPRVSSSRRRRKGAAPS